MAPQSIALILLLACSGAAHAQNYLVLGTGTSRVARNCADATVCDSRGTAYKLALGQRIDDGVMAEIGLIDFGRTRVGSESSSLSLTASGIGGGIALRQEVERGWMLTGRLGLASIDARATSVSPTSFYSGSQQTLSLVVGGGLGYRLHPNMTFDLSVDASRIKFNRSGFNATSGVRAILIGTTLDF